MEQTNRPLTYDERKAADAAFKGFPCDPKWSEAARNVYEGLSLAMANQRNETFQEVRLLEVATIAKQVVPESNQMSGMICREQP
jgi:hypothetical protein